MAQIIIQHDIDLPEQAAYHLRARLAFVCAELFSTRKIELLQQHFEFMFERIIPPSNLMYNITIRMSLHQFPERLKGSHEHADALREVAYDTLKSYGLYGDGAQNPTIAVELTYDYKVWSAMSASEIPDD